MLQTDWQKLPLEIQDFVWFKLPALNEQIFKKYGLKQSQGFIIEQLEEDIIQKKLDVLDLVQEIDQVEGLFNTDKRAFVLDLAYNIFWPLSGYLEHVDRLILRLGGKVPSHKIALGQNLTQKNIFPGTEKSTIKLLLNKYEDFKNLFLTSSKIKSKDGRQIAPTISNWLQDYINFLGAGDHSSLQRAQYLAKGPNVLSLKDRDKEKIQMLTLSYDEGQEFDFVLSDGILSIQNIKAVQTSEDNFDKVLAKLQGQISQWQSKLLPESLILSEINNDPNKFGDCLWDALGVPDKEKTISVLAILLQRKTLDRVVREDSRFKNIFKRFIELRYSRSFTNWPETNQDKLLAIRLFLEMILVEKLRLNPDDSVLVALYLSDQIVYFDKNDSQLKWREVKPVGSNLTWAYPI